MLDEIHNRQMQKNKSRDEYWQAEIDDFLWYSGKGEPLFIYLRQQCVSRMKLIDSLH